MFWIINAILIVVALAFILPSLLRNKNTLQDGRREQNIFIAKEQLKELEERFEQDKIDQVTYQSARDELEQSLFSDMSDNDISFENNAQGKTPWLSTVFIALAIPAIAISVYLKVGNPVFINNLDSKEAVAQASKTAVPRNADGTPDIEIMIKGLQKKMEERPSDPKGWYMLGRSYMVMKRYSEAVKAYDRAYQLKPDSAEVIMSLADAIAMQNDGQIKGRPVELINKALELEPDNLTALWLGGMAARQKEDYSLAIKRWNKVLGIIKDPKERQEVLSLIKEAADQLPDDQRKIEMAEITQAAPAAKTTPQSTGKGIAVTVSLSDAMKANAKPDDLVFIYAKAMSGPPMPLAAAKLTVKDLPAQIMLTDAMAMMPNMKLSSFAEVIVGARISKSGQPVAQNGDLFAEKKSIKLGDKVNLEINSVVSK